MKRFVSPIASGGGQVNNPTRYLYDYFENCLTFYSEQMIPQKISDVASLVFVLPPTLFAFFHQSTSTALRQ